MNRTRLLVPSFLLFALVGVHAPAHAQFGDFGKKLKQKVEQKVEQRIDRKTDKAVDDTLDKVECAATDTECVEKAKAEGKEVKTIEPASTSGSASASATSGKAQPAALKPGQGAWANYDFKPGDRILLADDFSKDEVGDFPRRFEFRSGQMEIVEWNEGRWLRALASWPRARREAAGTDLVLLNGVATQRLAPAMGMDNSAKAAE